MIIPGNIGKINTIDQLLLAKENNEITIHVTKNYFDLLWVSL